MRGGKRPFSPLDLFQNGLAIIGDSRITDGYQWWKNLSSSDWKGLPISGLGLPNPGITADSSGSLEYRASDANVRWTAPSDSAGPWTPLIAGIMTLESGTGGKAAIFGIRDLTTLPGSDQTVTVLVSGSVQYNWRSYGFWNRALNILRWPNVSPALLGIGGNTTAQVVGQLPYINTTASGRGYDIFHLGTNDIGNGTGSATIIANLTAIYDSRRALGRKGVLVGEPARWGVDTSTAMTAGQIVIFDAVNAFMASYAAAHGWTYIDTFTLTYDSGQSDRRPAAGMLRDTVHYSERGAQIVGQAIATALGALGIVGDITPSTSPSIRYFKSFDGSTGGTGGTGISGDIPPAIQVLRALGSDVTAVCALVARTDGKPGNWLEITISATASGQIIEIQPTPSSLHNLATLGLAAGDFIHAEFDAQLLDAVAVRNVDFWIDYEGSSPAHTAHGLLDSGTTAVMSNESGMYRTGRSVVPTATRARPKIWYRPAANSTAKFRIGSIAIVEDL